MQQIKQNYILFSLTALFIALNAYFWFDGNLFFNFIPVALIFLYIGVFYPKTLYLIVVFFTPISINIEEFNDGVVGLFLPTEPLLVGLMILIILRELTTKTLDREFWRHPISISLIFYLLAIFITALFSTDMKVSFKFLLMKSWYIIPLLTFGYLIFKDKSKIVTFLWCWVTSMTIVIIYTVIRHSSYGFGEAEGHWVMEPIFKDHTIYGAAVAIQVFFLLALLLYRKKDTKLQFLLLLFFIIALVGLYFSYTRGAWISVALTVGVWFLIRFKINIKLLILVGLLLGSIVYVSWDQIEIALARNTNEHTTTKFDERLSSAANITTDASNLERLNRWSAAWEMFKEKPIVGFGPGMYAFEYAPYQSSENLTIISTNLGDKGNAHSEYLGPLSEMGIIGFVSVIVFVFTLFYCGITLLHDIKKYTPEDKELYVLIFGVILALSTYFLHGFINNYLDSDKAAVPVYASAAIIIAQQVVLRRKIMKGAK